MTGLELKIAREILGLSQEEAAEHIGKVSRRSWSYWEVGRSAIKPDVAEFLQKLMKRRQDIIKQFTESKAAANAQDVVVIYYREVEDCPSFLDWKFSQSLARTLSIDFGVSLVDFDRSSFEQFRQGFGLEDTPAARSEWAVYQHSHQKSLAKND